jgi:hypothetical protein
MPPDPVPSSLTEVILGWISRHIGRWGVLIALALIAGVPTSIALHDKWKSMKADDQVESRKQLEALTTSAGAFQVGYVLFGDTRPNSDILSRDLIFNSTIEHSDDTCEVSVVERRQETQVQEELVEDTRTITTRFPVSDVENIEVKPFSDQFLETGFTNSSEIRYYRGTVTAPYTITLGTEGGPAIFDVDVSVDEHPDWHAHGSAQQAQLHLSDKTRANLIAKLLAEIRAACSARASVRRPGNPVLTLASGADHVLPVRDAGLGQAKEAVMIPEEPEATAIKPAAPGDKTQSSKQ